MGQESDFDEGSERACGGKTAWGIREDHATFVLGLLAFPSCWTPSTKQKKENITARPERQRCQVSMLGINHARPNDCTD
jgi:hypothetical protein